MSTRKLFLLLFFYCDIVFAASSAIEIPPVVLRLKQAISYTNGPKWTLTRDEILQSKALHLSEALHDMAGLQTRDSFANGSQAVISLRGFGENATSNTLVLMNGIPITNPDLAPANLNTIPLYAISAVEIIAGSESVLYGDEAVAGVINIITAPQKKNALETICRVGSFRARQCLATLYLKAPFLLNTSFFMDSNDHYRQHNHARQTTFNVTSSHKNNTSENHFDLNWYQEHMQYPGALSSTQVKENRRQANNTNDYFKNSGLLANYRHLYRYKNFHLENRVIARPMEGQGILYSHFTQKRQSYAYQSLLKFHTEKLSARAGLDLRNDQYQLQSLFGWTGNTQYQGGIYALAQYAWRPNIFINYGLRGAFQRSDIDSFGSKFIINKVLATTLGTSLTLSEKLQVYLRRAGNYRFPKADENAMNAYGIKGLNTQRGTSFETGAFYKDQPLHLNINLFLLALRDEIAFDPEQTPVLPFGSNRNLPPTKRYGASITYQVRLLRQLKMDGQYNYVHARFNTGLFQGNRIPLVAEHIARMGINFSISEIQNLYMETIYTGNQIPANDDANQSGLMGGYTVFNFSARYIKSHFIIDLHINNIFAKKYYLYTFYQKFLDSQFFYPAPERTYTLGLKFLLE